MNTPTGRAATAASQRPKKHDGDFARDAAEHEAKMTTAKKDAAGNQEGTTSQASTMPPD